ncbi:branched-chain amino acid ABC transporter substrate-binding protein [Kaistia sp. 32K]|uniref:ABC transporter substrate-binding protein n=1 Tax=Kaistia sp. 32K TaxID=2795690 RepID=UPI001915DA73|nr:ABC transporter substrate-binding protein [Kaistia sp. 32K]BCP52219.1 branched-chain amino acid ABC transporter substrate-binding protein [Kaistia sp. 32K]
MRRILMLATAAAMASLPLLAARAAEEAVIIGAATASSGWMAPYDEGPVSAAQVAVDEINEAGGVLGHPLKLVHVDTKTDRAEAAKAAAQLAGQGAKAIIVSADFDMGGPAALVANQEGVLAFSTNGADIKLGNKAVGPYVFTLATEAEGAGALLADWAYRKQGWKTGYLLEDTALEYTKSLARGFKAGWTKVAGADALVGEDSYKNADPSVAAQVSRLAALDKKPDFIFLAGVTPGFPAVLRQLRAAGIDAPVIGGVGFDGDEWHGALPPEALTKVYYGSYSSARGDDPRPEIASFLERFKARNGGKPPASGGLAVSGYSAVYAWARAAERAGSVEPAKVLAELEKFKDEPLLVGPTTFTPDLHINRSRATLIVGFDNAKATPLGYYDPAAGDYVEWWKN